MMKRFVLGCALVLSLVAGGMAEDVTIAGSAVNKTLTLQGEDSVSVTGSSNHLVLEGNGDSLSVMGSSNHLSVKAKIDSVNVMGSMNELTIDGVVDSVNLVGSGNKVVLIKRAGRALPDVSRVGQGNTVTEQDAR